jgi:CBS domain-containing protein
MLTARDIMTRDVVCVKTDTPIRTALELLVEHNISGIPVVEDDMTLVAIISERDILRLFDATGDVEGKTVSDFMTQPAVFFEEHESISDVCQCLADNHFRRVPVSSHGVLVGIVSRRDIIKNIMHTKFQSAAFNSRTCGVRQVHPER